MVVKVIQTFFLEPIFQALSVAYMNVIIIYHYCISRVSS